MTSSSANVLAARCEASPGEDARCVVAAREGDGEAILRLLERHRPALVRLLAGMLGDWAGAEDLAQEAFLKAFRSLKQLRDPALFYPWLRRLAVRLALRELRGRRMMPADRGPEPEAGTDPAAAAETRLVVREILARVPPDLRVTLVLREMEGLDYSEIAEALGIPVGTVRSRLFAARERFRVLWMESVES